MTEAKEVILITGCSGRIGTQLAQKFVDQRYRLVGLDVVSPKISSTNFEFICCDLTIDDDVTRAMNYFGKKYGTKIASVIHLAAYNRKNKAKIPQKQLSHSVTKRLLGAIEQFQIEQFLFSSSILVHSPCPLGKKITERSPFANTHWYAKDKIATEQLLRKRLAQIPLVILRIACCYDQNCHFLPLSHQVQRIYENQWMKEFFPGDPCNSFAYVHLDDMTDAIWLAVQRRYGLPKEFIGCVAELETVSYGELQKVIGLLCHGRECKTYPVPKWLVKLCCMIQNNIPLGVQTTVEPSMVDLATLNYGVDIAHVQEYLGWAPKRTLRQTLPKMIAALKENPLAWYRENGLINVK